MRPSTILALASIQGVPQRVFEEIEASSLDLTLARAQRDLMLMAYRAAQRESGFPDGYGLNEGHAGDLQSLLAKLAPAAEESDG